MCVFQGEIPMSGGDILYQWICEDPGLTSWPYHPVGWVPLNPFEKHIYQLPHIGDVYNRDKKMVWGKILKAPSNTPSWEWIK